MATKKKLTGIQNTVDKFFSDPEPVQTGKTKKTDTHKTFSFWAPKEDADSWRTYAKARGVTMDDMGTEAFTEYMKNHPLTDEQKQLYELLKKTGK